MPEKQPRTGRQGLVAIIGVGLIVMCAALVMMIPSPQSEEDLAGAPRPAPPVSVLTVRPDRHQARIRVPTIVNARYDLTVRSAVTAQIVDLSAQSLPGERVDRGDVLARLDETALRAHLAEVVNRLAAADVALALAERESEQAIAAWARSGEAGPPPALVARTPQLNAARAERDAARAAQADARRMLDEAVITAPISGVIVERYVSPGAHITVGEAVVRLQHDDVLDATAQISPADLALLPDTAGRMEAVFVERPGGAAWPARVRAVGAVMDAATRQASVYLERRQTENRLRAGSVVEAVIAGREIDRLYRVPESAWTRDGVIWVVRDGDRLDRIAGELVFLLDGYAHLRLPDSEQGALRVAVNPVSGFTRGNRVAPVGEG